MEIVFKVVQVIIALGIMNVWLFRSHRKTNWRGGNAANMREEFQVYGLPPWSMKVVGSVKLLCALLLIVGLSLPMMTKPAALCIAVLMAGAVAMHFKVGDPVTKSVPALGMLALSSLLVFAY